MNTKLVRIGLLRFALGTSVLGASLLVGCGASAEEAPPPLPPPPPPIPAGAPVPTATAQVDVAQSTSAETTATAPAPAPTVQQQQTQAGPLPALPSQAPQYAAAPADDATPPPQSQWVYSYPTGQWVYTAENGWIWVPNGSTTTVVEGVPYTYLYTPSYGWTWYVSPWGWGPYHYGVWVRHPWRPVGYRGHWVAHPHVVVRIGGHPHYVAHPHYGGGHRR